MPQFQAKTTKKRVINNSELIIVNISFCSSWTMGVINLLAFNSWTMNVMNSRAKVMAVRIPLLNLVITYYTKLNSASITINSTYEADHCPDLKFQ
ncbi:hypothetical protein RCL_jg8614.t2 [Rhizophagus clarus]|uniref:Uncharacterized protein n=1 Tax=Rhizophagus clarus TaxID=94130 RepID=A0A8H3M416_9GLOM|nr:hypothetical protein RCL_jg8614.t2 [Rhizophagus clarus]